MKSLARAALPRSGAGVVGALLILTMPSILSTRAVDAADTTSTSRATFGGGCFWCTEAVFETVPGVVSVVSGYAGGHTAKPTYRQVCGGGTGHAEVIQIEFDPAKVSYEQLLELFWEAHDPTTLNRQGADVGDQYRSIILFHDDGQHVAAEKSKTAAQAKFGRPIVTQIVALGDFFRAEDYHQDYFRNNRRAPYCAAVIAPKLRKLGRE